MVKFVYFLPLVLASRNKRSTVEIDSIEKAALQFLLDPNGVATNGCHCPVFGNTHTAFFGTVKNNRDRACKQWMATRDCLFLSGGVCEGNSTPSYTYDNDVGYCNQSNDCDRALCEADKKFADDINALNEAYEVIADNNALGECVRANDRPEYDACCGSDLSSFAKYVSTESRCAYDNVITENCPAGQQKNEITNTCEACPDNTFSANSQCVPCNSNADILIVYDGSGSMKNDANDGTSRTRWQVQKQFVQTFVSNFEVASDKIRFRAVQYNKNPKYHWDFDGGDESTELNTRTENISQYDKTLCSTCSQFQKVYNDFSGIFSNARPDANKVILVFADGLNGSTTDDRLQAGMDWAEANDAQIYFVRIGSGNLDGRNWESFVFDESNFIETGSEGWAALDSLSDLVANKICSA